ncbi:hypothetical protein XA68_14723 [Ophiocordyceps unilateralis]|uniref:Enterotoxin n=1 Tax=Ophiocordyceps unilateralis TaxID=268505 RepID=A0A2A9PMS8_OPHUN|nr:hypothetical protein XA68_14723 [Ophiocordyceps unilateralis]
MAMSQLWSALVLAFTTSLLLWPGSSDAQPPPPPRFRYSMETAEFVYILIPGVLDVTPAMFRHRGGIFMADDMTFDHDEAYGYDNMGDHYAYTPVSTSIDETISGLYMSRRGWWLYRITASLNMMPRYTNGRGYSHAALGGVPWTMVHSFTVFLGNEQPRAFVWQDNADYDPRWEAFGLSGPQPLLSGRGVPEGTTLRELAVSFMNGLTGPQNQLFNDSSLQTLRELFDWDVQAEPNRNFPLLRRFQPMSLVSASLAHLNWNQVTTIPPRLRLVLAGGLPTRSQCALALGAPGLGPSGFKRKRSEEESCQKLATLVQDKYGLAMVVQDKYGLATEDGERNTTRRLPRPEDMVKVDAAIVLMCKNDNFNPPCIKFETPPGECVPVPDEYLETVSAVLPNKTAGSCHIYTGLDCTGTTIEIQHSVPLSLWDEPLKPFNDQIGSIRCDGAYQPAEAVERWEWSPETMKEHCSHFDQLRLHFNLSSDRGSGTYDKLWLAFPGAPNMHPIVDGPPAGFEEWQTINLQEVFMSSRVEVAGLKSIGIAGTASFPTALFAMDEFTIAGIKLSARCAGSGIMVDNNKYLSLEKSLKVGDRFGEAQKGATYALWEGGIGPEDWVAKPPCSHFEQLSLTLEVADESWAGTSNDLHALVGSGKFHLASHPSRREVFSIDMNLEEAFGSKVVKVGQISSLAIRSEGGHDQALLHSVTMRAICAGRGKSVMVETEVDKWIADGTQWSHQLEPEMWTEIQV